MDYNNGKKKSYLSLFCLTESQHHLMDLSGFSIFESTLSYNTVKKVYLSV